MERLLDPPSELGLRAAGEPLLGETGEHLVGDRACAPDRLDLARLLDPAEILDGTVGDVSDLAAERDEVDACGAQPTIGVVRDVRRLDGDAPAGEQ